MQPLWIAVQTKPRAEDKALTHLTLRQVTTFMPRLLVTRRHGSRRWQAAEPLFPGYLFAHIQPNPAAISSVRWTPGVRRLLDDGEMPIPVADDIILHLQERTGERGYIVPGSRLAPGAQVRFRTGPMRLLEGIIERPVSRGQRVRVLLTLMGLPAVVEVDADEIEVIKTH